MNGPSREEIDAKLATVEARLDARVAAIEASIDGLVLRMDDRDRRWGEQFAQLRELLSEQERRIGQQLNGQKYRTGEQLAQFGERLVRLENAFISLKTTMLVTAASTVIATILGVGAINATLLSSMIAAFQTGSNMGAIQVEVKRQVEETAALLKQMQERMPPPAPAGPAKPPSRP